MTSGEVRSETGWSVSPNLERMRRTSSTFSCDTAYSASPTALRASPTFAKPANTLAIEVGEVANHHAVADRKDCCAVPAHLAHVDAACLRTGREVVEHEDAPVAKWTNLISLNPRLLPFSVDRPDALGRRLPADPSH